MNILIVRQAIEKERREYITKAWPSDGYERGKGERQS